MHSESSYFVWLNRGKRSVMLDIATPQGGERLAALLDQADILVQNLKPVRSPTRLRNGGTPRTLSFDRHLLD